MAQADVARMHERAYVSEERLVLTAFAAYGGGFLASKLLLAPLDRWQLELLLFSQNGYATSSNATRFTYEWSL